MLVLPNPQMWQQMWKRRAAISEMESHSSLNLVTKLLTPHLMWSQGRVLFFRMKWEKRRKVSLQKQRFVPTYFLLHTDSNFRTTTVCLETVRGGYSFNFCRVESGCLSGVAPSIFSSRFAISSFLWPPELNLCSLITPRLIPLVTIIFRLSGEHLFYWHLHWARSGSQLMGNETKVNNLNYKI